MPRHLIRVPLAHLAASVGLEDLAVSVGVDWGHRLLLLRLGTPWEEGREGASAQHLVADWVWDWVWDLESAVLSGVLLPSPRRRRPCNLLGRPNRSSPLATSR